MNCAECQNQIFDGELDRDAVVHLTECAECRALDHEVRLNTATLAGLREEVIAVRTPRRRWPWVAASAAAAAMVTVAVWPTSTPAPVPAPLVAVLEPLPAAPATPPIAEAVPVKRVRPVRRPKPAPLAARPAEPLMVKFFTDDPNVVIYWQIDPPKGEIGL